MNCEECKNLISVFMDNDLDASTARSVRMHLAVCTQCALVCEDFASILDVCKTESPTGLVPPNSQALWCRINNIIESETNAEPAKQAEAPRGRFWRLSFPQLAAAVLCIAVISSLLTVVAFRNYTQPSADDFTTRTAASQTTFEKFLSKVGMMDTPQQARDRRVRQQIAAIDYWDKRVQARRVQWDKNVREKFDRNLNEINEAVSEYTLILQEDPQDDLSGEMLDSVLEEKMKILREFSEL